MSGARLILVGSGCGGKGGIALWDLGFCARRRPWRLPSVERGWPGGRACHLAAQGDYQAQHVKGEQYSLRKLTLQDLEKLLRLRGVFDLDE
jgi:hypothetical protein